MLNTLIVGASGYAGAELVTYVNRHPDMTITALTVSAQSNDAGKLISDLHPQLKGIVDLPLQPMSDISEFSAGVDVVFLATAHEVSHDLAPQFLQAGCVVFDLSGAFRVNDGTFYEKYYGFTHQHPELLEQAVYGLAEWNADKLKEANLIAVPGCYPTAAQLSLKPLIDAGLLDLSQWPVINATSGVSGAGRKAAISNSFCEVSLQPYGVFTHRHQPEIATHLGTEVIFTPHLGNFPRGILETITCRLKAGVTHAQVAQALQQAYGDKPLVRLYDKGVPALKNVVGLPFCDIGFAVQGEHLIVVATEDNLLKGAAAQAMQCANIRFGFAQTQSLIDGDLINVLLSFGLVFPSLLLLTTNIFTTNGANLYSTSLNLANSFKLNRNIMLAVLIAISALATMTQPYKIDSLFVFLSTLGIIVPPLCGIILADFYLVHRGKYIDYNKATFKKWNLVPWITWAIALICVKFIPFGLASLNGIVIGALLYALITYIVKPNVVSESKG